MKRRNIIYMAILVLLYSALLIPIGISIDKGSMLIPVKISIGLYLYAIIYSLVKSPLSILISVLILIIPIAIFIYYTKKVKVL